MNNFDLQEFLRIIEDEGCELRTEIITIGDERIQVALSREKQRSVHINITDEEMSLTTAKSLLRKLECEDLIERLNI